MTKLTNKAFCKLYNSFYGEQGMLSGIDSPKQLYSHTFSGPDLKEFVEHCIEFHNQL